MYYFEIIYSKKSNSNRTFGAIIFHYKITSFPVYELHELRALLVFVFLLKEMMGVTGHLTLQLVIQWIPEDYLNKSILFVFLIFFFSFFTLH